MTRRLATMCFLTVFLIGFSSPPVPAQNSKYTNPSLKGIRAVDVLVEPLYDGAEVLGLTAETIQTDVELRLRLAGMSVVTQEESFKNPGAPYVYINVTMTKSGSAAKTELELRQDVILVRNSQRAPAVPTWRTGYVSANPTAQDIRDGIRDSVDAFLNAWLSVNPKK